MNYLNHVATCLILTDTEAIAQSRWGMRTASNLEAVQKTVKQLTVHTVWWY